MKYTTIAALLTTSFFAACSAGPLDELKKAAKSGDVAAQTQLAEVHLYGLGDERKHQDAQAAISWLELAAKQGDISAHNLLGTIYLKGEYVPVNIDEAIHWLTRAAQLGDRETMNRLGYIFEYGKGVPADLAKAVKWYRASAD